MKIAVVSTPWIAVPPIGYGGTERVVYHIVEGMKKKNHDVTLFATGDSKVSSKLDYYYPKALGNNLDLKFNPYNILNHLYYCVKNIGSQFDIVHVNTAGMSLYFMDFLKIPFVYTLHGSYHKNERNDDVSKSGRDVLLKFKQFPYISISNKQREALPELNYVKTIYNGIIINQFEFDQNGGDSVVWLGRIAKTKGVEELMKVVIKLKRKLDLAAFIDQGEKDYFLHTIEPYFDNQLISFHKEIKEDRQKNQFLKNGRVFLFPIAWDEPFGIVMIESMACGTPVVAYARGSVPEVVKDGETGFIVNPTDDDIRGDWIVKKTGMEGLCEAVERIYSLSEDQYKKMRQDCRAHVEKNFTVERMVDAYEKVYEEIVKH